MLLTSSPWLHERSRTSVQEYLKHDDLILVPIGATEQHGRHTPLMVDTGWAIAVAEGAAWPPARWSRRRSTWAGRRIIWPIAAR